MDNRRKGALMASVIVVAAIVIALLWRSPSATVPVGPGSNMSGNNSTAVTGGKPVAPRQPVNLLAPPSSFPFVEKWVSQYNNENHPGSVHVDYTEEVDFISSGAYSNASDFLARHLADMAITGKPAPDGNFSGLLVPVSPQAIAIVYNVPGFPDVPSGLKFDGATLARVLEGNITRWDNTAIKGLNPGVSLPDKAIIVVHEGRPKSATILLEQYLSNATAWPEKSMAAESADSLSTVVRQTPYSIGYVEFTYAVQTRMTFAALQNADGQYIEPSAGSIAAAIRNGTAMQNSTAISGAQLGNGSYPIVGLYYAALGDVEKPAALDFAKWIAGEGQQVLKDMRYPSIYESSKALHPFGESLRQQGAQPRFNSTNLTRSEGESVYAQISRQMV